MNNRSALNFVATFAAGAAAGWLLHPHPPATARALAPASDHRMGTSTTSVPSHAGRPIADQVREIARLPDDAERDRETDRWLARLRAEDAPQALKTLRELAPGSARARLLVSLFRWWGGIDGRAALTAAHTITTAERRPAEAAALTGWAQRDANGAWQAAQAYISRNLAQSAVVFGALKQLATVDLDQAIIAAGNMPDGNTRSGARAQVINAALDSATLPALITRIMGIADSAARDGWLEDTFSRWAALSSDGPLQAAKQISDPAAARQAMAGLLKGWSEADPTGAVNYVVENRHEPMVNSAMGSVLQSAVRAGSSDDIRQMISRLESAQLLDAMSGSLLLPLAQSAPEIAAEMVAKLKDPAQQSARMSQLMSAWAVNDYEGATRYYESLPAGPQKTVAFPNVAYVALQRPGGMDVVNHWLNDLPADQRTSGVNYLIGRLQVASKPILPQNAQALSDALASMPGLPADVVARARQTLKTTRG